LYSEGNFKRRPAYDIPEIQRADLAPMWLSLSAHGLAPEELDLLSAPPEQQATRARELLEELEALDHLGNVTALGRFMQALPVHPRLARVVAEACRQDVLSDGTRIAAILSEPDVFRDLSGDAGAHDSDVLVRLERLREVEDSKQSPQLLRRFGMDRERTRTVLRVAEQLTNIAVRSKYAPKALPNPPGDDDERLGRCLLLGYRDRVARPKRASERALILCNGTRATLSERSVLRNTPLLLAVEVDERSAAGGQKGAQVTLGHRIEADWLLEREDPRLLLSEVHEWNDGAERVDEIARIAWGSVVLDETRKAAAPSAAASELLSRMAWNKRRKVLGKAETELEQLAARLQLLKSRGLIAGVETGDEDPRPIVAVLVEKACEGLTSFAELEELDWPSLATFSLSTEVRKTLERETPTYVTFKNGRRVPIQYEMEKDPWIASRLQDFFGLAQGPTTCGGRVALTLHLLAPNQRAVQITSDLAGFWQRHYPEIRRELMRRYPRHAWPEDGRSAEPPKPRPPRAAKSR
jgi:ATP-dependent helicase HrpB